MPQEGQRTRITRRSYARPGPLGNQRIGGRGLDIWADRNSYGQQYAVRTWPKVEAAKMKEFSQIGTPDALKGACPVWEGLGGNRHLKGARRLHSTSYIPRNDRSPDHRWYPLQD